MTISFDQIPANIRIPFTAVEFNASDASQGPALLAYRALIIGQKLAAGSGVADTVYKITRADEAIAIAGRGSMLHRQAIAWFAANTSTELWIGVLDDDGAGVSASGTITVTGAATADGVLAIYMGGKRLAVAVSDADGVNAVAASIAVTKLSEVRT